MALDIYKIFRTAFGIGVPGSLLLIATSLNRPSYNNKQNEKTPYSLPASKKPEPIDEKKQGPNVELKFQKQFCYRNGQPVIERETTPNYTAGNKRDISFIVLHTTEGKGNEALTWLKNPKSRVSAHYLIMEDGRIIQLLGEKDVAWHCRGYNKRSIGIEFAGFYDRPLGDIQVKLGAELIKNILKKYGLGKGSIKTHSELDPKRRKDPGKGNLEKILKGIN